MSISSPGPRDPDLRDAELAVVQEQHHDGIERAVLRPDERRQVGMSIGERAERRLDRRGPHISRLTPPMRSAKRFVKRIRGIQQWAIPGAAGQAFAISSISLSNTAQTRSLSCEKNSRVTNGGNAQVGVGPVEHFRRQRVVRSIVPLLALEPQRADERAPHGGQQLRRRHLEPALVLQALDDVVGGDAGELAQPSRSSRTKYRPRSVISFAQ